MKPIRNRVDERVGKLTVVAFHRRENKITYWLCRCDCGQRTIVAAGNLKSSNTTSCGCVKRSRGAVNNLQHGAARTNQATPEYRIWIGMKVRCYNAKSSGYAKYGARGITLCERWLNSFPDFLADMGPRPSNRHSIERRDNNGPYSPDNCYWATLREQAVNKRTTRLLTADGRTQCLQAWARELGCNHVTIIDRLRRGWTEEAAVTTPPLRR